MLKKVHDLLMCVMGTIWMIADGSSEHAVHYGLIFMQNLDRDVGGHEAVGHDCMNANAP